MRWPFRTALCAEFDVTLRDDAISIWRAGVDAVDAARLVETSVSVTSDHLTVCTEDLLLDQIDHIEVVGAGKAGAGMVSGLLRTLNRLPSRISVSGWVNVPADCVPPEHSAVLSDHAQPPSATDKAILDRQASNPNSQEALAQNVRLHAARPAGINEPQPAGVQGTREIINRVKRLGSRDLCLVLLSGGGSALLPFPVDGITLDDKLAVTRLLASAGATIQQLNTVRSQLSDIKGGRLLNHCRAGKLVSLIISDIIGDPVDLIASGPTQPTSATAADALKILKHYARNRNQVPANVWRVLETPHQAMQPVSDAGWFRNFVIGSNSTALAAAAAAASQKGYRVVSLGSSNSGEAAEHGRLLLRQLQQLRGEAVAGQVSVCVLAGGETTVTLAATDVPRKGGRNQEVVLAAVASQPSPDSWQGLTLLSAGTDGEDGPTDAAGAIADRHLVKKMGENRTTADIYLRVNNSYPFFQALDGLICTGPTHTNVMDLAVGLVSV